MPEFVRNKKGQTDNRLDTAWDSLLDIYIYIMGPLNFVNVSMTLFVAKMAIFFI